MFHIVSCCDENYIKYLSVLLTSIVKNTDTSKCLIDYIGENRKSYVFHILSDAISQETQDKIHDLQKELTKIYPCEILVHFVDESIFHGMPKWGFEATKNYSAYYRLALCRFIPADVVKCLYIDVDMLVMCDIRELFAIDLGECLAGVNSGHNFKDSRTNWILKAVDKHGSDFDLSSLPYYFCSGLMLLNMPLYRANNIESKCIEFLKTYKPICADQDALNVVLSGKIKILPAEYGVLTHFFCDFDQRKNKEQMEAFKQLIPLTKIAHVNGCTKPWFSPSQNIKSHDKKIVLFHPHYDSWWEIALQTPAFKEELACIKQTHRDYISIILAFIYHGCMKFFLILPKTMQESIKHVVRKARK